VSSRLDQTEVLASPLILSIINNEYQQIEERLNRIRNIPGVEALKKYRASKKSNMGSNTDDKARGLFAEILVLDFLMELNFTGIQKLPESTSGAHIEFIACRDQKKYAIEVTRKQEIEGWEIDTNNMEDCAHPSNQDKIRGLLKKALVSKNNHFLRAITSDTIDSSSIKVLAIKSSDYGFAECIDQAEKIAGELLSERGNWECVESIWLIPSVHVCQSRWVFKSLAG